MKKITALLAVVLLNPCFMNAMSMPMRMAPSVSMDMYSQTAPRRNYCPDYDWEPQNDRKRIESKKSRAVVRRIRQAEQTLHDVYKRKKPKSCLDEILELAVLSSSNDLIVDALKLGADPDYRGKDNRECLLDRTDRASAIRLLLHYGADPKLCKKAPIYRLLFYYFIRPEIRANYQEDNDSYLLRRRDDYWRRANKVFNCVQDLLKKGVDINEKLEGSHPVKELILWSRDSPLHFEIASDLLRKFIWRGAYYKDEWSRSLFLSERSEALCNYAIEEREKYNATIGFLSCAKYEDSPVHALPEELRKIIGGLAKQGFEFNYLKEPEPETSIEEIPEAVQVDIVEASSVDNADVSAVQASAVAVSDYDTESDDEDGEESESDRPMHRRSWSQQSAEIAIAMHEGAQKRAAENNSTLFSRRNLPQKITAVCCAAVVAKIGHSYWKRWCKLQKKQEKKERIKQQYKDLIESRPFFE
jgi:hypothetical protein